MSIWLSQAKLACVPPNPLNGPAGVVLVSTASVTERMCCHRYGPATR